jgi:transcriptional regulator with XRE-family HTH domain
MPQIVAFTLRRLRTAKGLSLAQLADRAKIDKQTIWRLEQGKHTETRESTIQKLARTLRLLSVDNPKIRTE